MHKCILSHCFIHLLLNLTFHTSLHATKHLRQEISNVKRDYVDIIFINQIKYVARCCGNDVCNRNLKVLSLAMDEKGISPCSCIFSTVFSMLTKLVLS